MQANLTVILGVAVYLAAILVIGAIAARKTNSADDFLVAGRQLPLWLCAATLTATWLGSGTVIGAAGAAYESGLLGVIADPFGAALCLFLAGLFYVRVLRRMRLITITDFFEIRFGPLCGMLSGIALFVLYIGWTGAQLVAFGLVMSSLFGTSTNLGMFVGTGVVLAYTAAGGMWAVALTDFIQVLVVAAGLLLMLPLVIGDAGGWGELMAQVPAGTFRMLPAENTATDWLDYLRAWLIIGIGSIATQDLMQRSFASRSESVAQNAAYLSGLAYLTIGMIPVLLGIVGAITIPGLEDPELVVPELALRHLHPVAMAVFVGALLAAIMSSADSALLAPASLLSANIVPYLNPRLSEKARFTWARYSVPVIGIAALAVALRAQRVYELMLDAFSITLVALFVPFTAGIWWSRANGYGALASMFAGTGVWLAAGWLFPAIPADMLGLLASLVVMVVVSLLTQKLDPPRPLTDRDGNPISQQNRLGVLSPFSGT